MATENEMSRELVVTMFNSLQKQLYYQQGEIEELREIIMEMRK